MLEKFVWMRPRKLTTVVLHYIVVVFCKNACTLVVQRVRVPGSPPCRPACTILNCAVLDRTKNDMSSIYGTKN